MNSELKKAMSKLLDLKISFCDNCGGERIEVSTEQSPTEVKGLVKLMGKGSKILFCKNCQEYGVISPMETSF